MFKKPEPPKMNDPRPKTHLLYRQWPFQKRTFCQEPADAWVWFTEFKENASRFKDRLMCVACLNVLLLQNKFGARPDLIVRELRQRGVDPGNQEMFAHLFASAFADAAEQATDGFQPGKNPLVDAMIERARQDGMI